MSAPRLPAAIAVDAPLIFWTRLTRSFSVGLMQVNVVIVAGIIPADKGWFGMAYLNERFQIFGMVFWKERFHIFWFDCKSDNKRVSSFSIIHKMLWMDVMEFPGNALHLLRVYKSDALLVMPRCQRGGAQRPQTKLALWSSHCSEIWNLNGRGNENDIDWG